MGLLNFIPFMPKCYSRKKPGGCGGGGERLDDIKNLQHLLHFFKFYPIRSIVTF